MFKIKIVIVSFFQHTKANILTAFWTCLGILWHLRCGGIAWPDPFGNRSAPCHRYLGRLSGRALTDTSFYLANASATVSSHHWHQHSTHLYTGSHKIISTIASISHFTQANKQIPTEHIKVETHMKIHRVHRHDIKDFGRPCTCKVNVKSSYTMLRNMSVFEQVQSVCHRWECQRLELRSCLGVKALLSKEMFWNVFSRSYSSSYFWDVSHFVRWYPLTFALNV